MSNLGWYQVLTTTAKQVGGPKNLVGIMLSAGAIVGSAVTIAIGKLAKEIDKKVQMKEWEEISTKTYVVTKNGRSNSGVDFNVGDKFKVLSIDRDVCLIIKIGDNNNPYYESYEFIKSISDFRY